MPQATQPSTTPRPLYAGGANDNIQPVGCRWRRLIDSFNAIGLPQMAAHAAEQKLKGRDFDRYIETLLTVAQAVR